MTGRRSAASLPLLIWKYRASSPAPDSAVLLPNLLAGEIGLKAAKRIE